MKIKVQPRQTNLDLALQYYGAAEGLSLLMRDNPDKVTIKNLHLQLPVGTELLIRSTPINAAVVSAYQKNKITPATAEEPSTTTAPGDFNNDFNNDFF